MSNLANNTVTMNEILALIDSLPEGGGGDPLIEFTNTGATELAAGTWFGFPYAANVTYANVKTVGANAFRNFAKLKSVDLPVATEIGAAAFFGCNQMTYVNMPLLTSIPQQAFLGCQSLTEVVFPAVTSVGNRAFATCTVMKIIDLPAATSLTGTPFSNCWGLTAIILRSSTMCAAAATNVLSGINSTNGFYVYVPAALVDSYKADANWSTYADQFRALESYTVDGTTTGALDETKI